MTIPQKKNNTLSIIEEKIISQYVKLITSTAKTTLKYVDR